MYGGIEMSKIRKIVIGDDLEVATAPGTTVHGFVKHIVQVGDSPFTLPAPWAQTVQGPATVYLLKRQGHQSDPITYSVVVSPSDDKRRAWLYV